MSTNAENKRIRSQSEHLVKVNEIAKLIGKSVRRVQQLTQEGVFSTVDVKNGNRISKRYDMYETSRKYIEYVKAKAENKVISKEDEKVQVEIDIKKIQLKRARIELEELGSRMHDAEDVKNMTIDLILFIRSKVLTMPDRLSADLVGMDDPAEISARIHQTVCDVLNELAEYEYDPKEYEKRAEEN